eukprot:sb/3465068/
MSFRGFSTAAISTAVIFLVILSFQTLINERVFHINHVIVEHIDVKFEIGEQHNITIDVITNDTKEEEKKEEVFIVFVIPIRPTDFERRQVIRETWANRSSWIDFNEKSNTTSPQDEFYRRFAIMFIIADPDLEYKEAAAARDEGESDDETVETSEEDGDNASEKEAEDELDVSELLKEEAERYGDIYDVDGDVDGLDEGYRMIKYKVLWGMRQSLVLYNATYIIKTDGDILVNIPVLISRLKLANRTGLYTGACYAHRLEPDVREYMQIHGRFPNWKYCLGGGYILSRDVVERIMELSREVARIPIIAEDMYTGYLVDRLQEPAVRALNNGGWMQLGLHNVDPSDYSKKGSLKKFSILHFFSTVHPPKSCAELFCAFITFAGVPLGMRCNPLFCTAAPHRNEGIEANAARAFVLRAA